MKKNIINSELYIEADELIEDIFAFKREKCKDFSIMDTIIEYSNQKEIPIQEIGNILSEHKDFMEIFERSLIREGYLRDSKREVFNTSINDEEW